MNTIIIARNPTPVCMIDRPSGDVEITAWKDAARNVYGKEISPSGEAVIAVIPKANRELVASFLKGIKQ